MMRSDHIFPPISSSKPLMLDVTCLGFYHFMIQLSCTAYACLSRGTQTKFHEKFVWCVLLHTNCMKRIVSILTYNQILTHTMVKSVGILVKNGSGSMRNDQLVLAWCKHEHWLIIPPIDQVEFPMDKYVPFYLVCCLL